MCPQRVCKNQILFNITLIGFIIGLAAINTGVESKFDLKEEYEVHLLLKSLDMNFNQVHSVVSYDQIKQRY